MKTLKEKIEVMQAAEDGAKIESSWVGEFREVDLKNLLWNWEEADYRIKPKPIEFWVNVYESGPGLLHFSTEEKAEAESDGSNSFIKTVRMVEAE